MMTKPLVSVSRRQFLQHSAALVIGLHLPLPAKGFTKTATESGDISTGDFQPNAFVSIGQDSLVKVMIRNAEMGQGTLTGLATLVAEELDADWSQMHAELAPANGKLYGFGRMGWQVTGGSRTIAMSYLQMRQAGANARALLVQAASELWNVAVEEITISKGIVSHHASQRSTKFGDLVSLAATFDIPTTAALKAPDQFTLIGNSKGYVKRLDSRDKSTGKARFGLDIYEDDMLTVVVASPLRKGARLVDFNAKTALAIDGVVTVKTIPLGIAVYARTTWAAIKARNALKINWDESQASTLNSEDLFDHCAKIAEQPGDIAFSKGDADAALATADSTIDLEFRFPFLAHAPMECLNGTIYWDGKTAHTRFGCQSPTLDQMSIARELGIKQASVKIDVELSGGSFGRRSETSRGFVEELCDVAKAFGKAQPLKLMWTREDDIQGGFYRPLTVHRVKAGIKDGKISAWHNRIAGGSVVAGTPFAAHGGQNGVDETIVEGLSDLPYEIDNIQVEAHIVPMDIPVNWWRSVAHSHTAYVKECVVDMLLQQANIDPIAGRLALLDKSPRLAGVIKAVAKQCDWGNYQAPKGRALGVAAIHGFGSYVAQIAEVSVQPNKEPRVHKVWCAIDCGVAINPDIIRAQMEGGIGYGIGHILFSKIDMVNGIPQHQNFHNYRSLKIHEMPEVEVFIVPSAEAPTGVGEPGLPPIGPAIANAMARLGLKRPTQLPIVNT